MPKVIIFIIGFVVGELIGFASSVFFHNVKENDKRDDTIDKES